MAKAAKLTREELLAQLNIIDSEAETAQLQAEIKRLTQENATLLAARKGLERELSTLKDDMQAIRKVVGTIDRKRGHVYVRSDAHDPGAISNRMGMAHVLVGIANGTHDPKTGIEYTQETIPVRDLSAGTRPVTQSELGRVFPELERPAVELSDLDQLAAIEALTSVELPNLSTD